MVATSRERLVAAAFTLFESQGYDGTTVDQIAKLAGTGRSTFFRHFHGKEDVVLPDHEALLGRVAERLSTANRDSATIAVHEAARVVWTHYLAEGDQAQARYRLTSSIPAIRDREIASVQRYVRTFTHHLAIWLSGEPMGALRAELLAAAVVIAHNHVLRQWLREEISGEAAEAALTEALTLAVEPLNRPGRATGAATVVITRGAAVEDVLAQVRSALTSA